MRTRVVITGMGIVSPIGIGVSEFWKSALAGQSGISTITSFDPFPMDGYRSKVAGQVRDFAIERFLDSAHGERVDRYAQFALVSTKEALADSGLQMAKENPHRIGVIVGAGMGGMVMGEREITQLYQQQKPHRVHPNFIPVITLNSASGIIAMAYGAKGPNLTISPASSALSSSFSSSLSAPTPALLPLSSPDFVLYAPSPPNSTISRRRPRGHSIDRETVLSWEKAPEP